MLALEDRGGEAGRKGGERAKSSLMESWASRAGEEAGGAERAVGSGDSAFASGNGSEKDTE